jgi:haloalkane dehalogenase
MHGNPTWSFLYRKLIPLLRAGGLRCIAMDLAGHGLSSHPDGDFRYTGAEHAELVRELIRHLDLKDLVVLGQDWGGPIGLSAAADEPERVSAIVLGYTFAWPDSGFFVWLVAKIMASAWGQRLIAGGNFTARVMKALLRRRPTAEELRHWTQVHTEPEHRRSLQMLPRELLNRPWLSQLEQRVHERLHAKRALLFRAPGLDEWLFGQATRHFARLLPIHQIVPLPHGGGHFFQDDAPEPTASAILNFLEPGKSGA